MRFYTTRGLVPPPIRRGRSGYYSADHLARLELVRELQAHGFTLAAIEKYVARSRVDATPETIALHRTLLAPWMAELPETMSRRELARRAGRDLTDERPRHPQRARHRVPDQAGEVPGRGRAPLGRRLRLLDLGMPLDAALAAQDIFTAHGRAIADELTELFRTKVWPAYVEGGCHARPAPRGRGEVQAGDRRGPGHGLRVGGQRDQARDGHPPHPLSRGGRRPDPATRHDSDGCRPCPCSATTRTRSRPRW